MKILRGRKVGVMSALSAIVALVGLPAISVSIAAPAAYADGLGYPNSTMQCVHTPYSTDGSGYWCPGYSWGTIRNNDTYASILSGRGYAYRNCTDYVAWKLQNLGVPDGKTRGLGNGGDWYANAPGNSLTRGSTPAVGAAAIVQSATPGYGGYGHVAYVEAVRNDGAITVSEYSFNLDGKGWVRSGTPASLKFTQFVYFAGLMTNPPSSGGGSTTPALPSGASPIKNGGFNGSYAYWSASGSANIAHYTSAPGMTPYEGSGFVATNASQSSDSISQTGNFSINAADTFCASAYVVTIGGGGGSGALALWLLGGNSNEYSSYSFSNLPGSNGWTQAKTCVTATTNHTQIKVQVYPNPGAPTIGVDAVDVHQTLSANGGFNNGMTYWGAMPGTNCTSYTNAQSTSPYEGSRFAATNTAAGGGSIFQDLPRVIGTGDTFCVDAQLVTVGDAAGAAGSLVIWLIGESPTETSAYSFSNLPGGSAWSPAKACATATGAHTMIRVQLYPAVNMPTVGIDAVDVHASIAQNSGFNADSGHWSAVGSLSYMTYQNVDGTLPYEGGGFEIIHVDASGGSFSQTRGWNIAAGETFCAEASVVAGGYAVGGSGILALWIMGGPDLYGSSINFSGLQGGNNWRRVKTCTTANAPVPNAVIKVEFYPTPGGPAIGIDAVDVH